ncbi:hypothetical protein [Proteus mirabilis]|uniref:hypothetical protein n=1 Tax=Proteus mirabilis TaxID=584 RepID=UPI0034D606E2
MYLNKSLPTVISNVREDRYIFENNDVNSLCLYKIEKSINSIMETLGIINYPNSYHRTPFACISNNTDPAMEVFPMKLPYLGGLSLPPKFNGETRKMQNSYMYCEMKNGKPFLIIEFPYLNITEVDPSFIRNSRFNITLDTYLKYPSINSTRIRCELFGQFSEIIKETITFLEWYHKYTFSLQFHNLRNFFLFSDLYLRLDDGNPKFHVDEEEKRKTLEMYNVLDFLKNKHGKV